MSAVEKKVVELPMEVRCVKLSDGTRLLKLSDDTGHAWYRWSPIGWLVGGSEEALKLQEHGILETVDVFEP